MDDIREFLESHLRPLAGPYLFVGAGFARRYANLPSWRDLLARFAEPTGSPLGYFETGTLPEAATNLAAAFREVWWKSGDYSDSLAEWGDSVSGSVAMPLKVEIAKYLDNALDGFEPPDDLADEYALLKNSTIDGVITTNYDRLLRLTFPTYRQFIGQDGLLFSDTQGIAEIYSIHGATEEPASLVLTAEDYEAYEDRNAYLAAKLLTIFVEHPILFIGYSFNDPNIHNLLISLTRGLRNKTVEKLQDRLIFVEYEEGVTPRVERTQVSVNNQLIPVIRLLVPDWRDVFAALGAREHALPARTLRILKQQVYEIVLQNDPKERLYAYRDIDDESAEDISIVFGVGAKVATIGIVGLSRADVWNDVLGNPDGGYPAGQVLDRLISQVPAGHYYPVFKYLREFEALDEAGQVRSDVEVKAAVRNRAASTHTRIKTSIDGVTRTTFAELLAEHDWKWILQNGLRLPAYTHDVDGLRQFLIENQDKVRVNAFWPTQYGKAVVAYDFMKYGLAVETTPTTS